MSTTLRGKGLWAYSHGDTADFEARIGRALELAPQMGATHILFKVGQGTNYYQEKALEAHTRIRQAGLVPFAWMWLTLSDPSNEAQLAKRAFDDGYEGLIFNMEEHHTNPNLSCVGRFDEAIQLGQHLEQLGVDENHLYLCSFPNISMHRNLPYDQMGAFCRGGTMPMAYGTFLAGGWSVETIIDEWTYGDHQEWNENRGDDLPVYPALGPYRDEHGTDLLSPEEFSQWLERLAGHSPTFFSVYAARSLNPALLPLLSEFQLATVEPESVFRRLVTSIPRILLNMFAPDPGGGDSETPEIKVVVNSPDVGFLRLRAARTTDSEELMQIPDGTVIYSLEGDATAAKVGVREQWLHVRVASGEQGYVGAWYLRFPGEPVEPPAWEDVPVIVHSPQMNFLRLRAEPTTNSEELLQIPHGATIFSLEGDATRNKVGQPGQWLHVRLASGEQGYVGAWHLRFPGEPVPVDEDTRQPVTDAALKIGQSAWIYGMHITSIDEDHLYGDQVQGLFAGSGKRGWVLFTEEIGREGVQPNEARRNLFWDWANTARFGVIVRLNHRYEPEGTLPQSGLYQAFADTCAGYARHYLARPGLSPSQYRWTIIIANEQNNPREWPGGGAAPTEIITPQLYAQAFNEAYTAIKAELGEAAIVVPGAVDPYNFDPRLNIKPLDYFIQMLQGIQHLDGIALHTYTHGLDVGFVTHKLKFANAPLTDHYYDFQAYRPFMQSIPSRWRNVPVYITETNHLFKTAEPDWGWRDENVGWIRAAYREINNWNNTSHVQQIQALLLYRWAGDDWIMRDKGTLLQDFRQVLPEDYRWKK